MGPKLPLSRTKVCQRFLPKAETSCLLSVLSVETVHDKKTLLKDYYRQILSSLFYEIKKVSKVSFPKVVVINVHGWKTFEKQ